MDDAAFCASVTGRSKIRSLISGVQGWSRRHLPPGLRLVVGVALMIGGLLGFLPIIGFWMFPLGVAVAALDVMPIWRAMSGQKKGPCDE